jgi:hypothetical protein
MLMVCTAGRPIGACRCRVLRLVLHGLLQWAKGQNAHLLQSAFPIVARSHFGPVLPSEIAQCGLDCGASVQASLVVPVQRSVESISPRWDAPLKLLVTQLESTPILPHGVRARYSLQPSSRPSEEPAIE